MTEEDQSRTRSFDLLGQEFALLLIKRRRRNRTRDFAHLASAMDEKDEISPVEQRHLVSCDMNLDLVGCMCDICIRVHIYLYI